MHNDLAFSKVNDSLALLVETTEQCFVIDSVNAGLLKIHCFFYSVNYLSRYALYHFVYFVQMPPFSSSLASTH